MRAFSRHCTHATARTAQRFGLSLLTLMAQLSGTPLLHGAASAICAAPGSSGAGGTLSGVINTYFASPATASVAAGATSVPLGTVSGAGTSIKAGDLLLIIQMQGAAINSTNTTLYGAGGTTGRGSTAVTAGTYEYVKATGAGVAGGSVPVTATLNSYAAATATATAGRSGYQVVVVPQYSTATTGSTLTARPWDGASGGILAFDTSGVLTVSGTVTVNAQGFRGGGGRGLGGVATGATNTDYVNSSAVNAQGSKAEGYAGTPRYTFVSGGAALTDNGTANGATNPLGYPNGDTARGAPGNAGGGGTDGKPTTNDQNSGGGGGGNGGVGGQGGNTWSSNLALGGVGGDATPFSAARLFPGGGGGAGSRNNGSGVQSSGGSGGGMIFVRAAKLAGSGSFTASGGVGVTPANDGGGGGGAGGSILLYAGTSTASVTLTANGAAGTNADPTGSSHGPGGGGAGGVIYTNVTATTSATGGANGTTTTGLLPYGATSGSGGSVNTALTRAAIPGVTPSDACTPASTQLAIIKQQQNVTDGGALGTAAVQVKPGQTIRYVLTGSNNTFATATAVTLRDPLGSSLNPPASGTLTCPDGTTRTVTLGAQTVSVDAVTACGQTLKPGQIVSLEFSATVK